MKKLLCPSMMCADAANLGREMRELEEAECDIFHLDVMDGSFVPNFGMGMSDVAYIAGKSRKPCDVHLMIRQPDAYISRFTELGVKIVYIHAEADIHAPRTLQRIRDLGASPGLALNPGTPAAWIEPCLTLVDYVLVMTVNPGFAGQKYLPFVDEKIDRLIEWKQRYAYKVIIDGACSEEKVKELSAKGADGFVLGTSALFGKGRPYKTILAELRER